MLEEIAEWPLDAEADDTRRYFTPPAFTEAIDSGERLLITGESGAGKSAITMHLAARGAPHRPTKRLAVKDAFFAAFPRDNGRGDEHVKALGEYLVLLGVFEALIGERRIEGGRIRALATLFALDIGERLENALNQVFSPAIIFEVFAANPAPPEGRPSPIDGLPALRDGVLEALGPRKAYVILDEVLDPARAVNALDVLKTDVLSAFMAAADTLTAGDEPTIVPLFATRRAVFERLDLDERRAWSPRRADIVWTREGLMSLAAFRVARAASDAFSPGEYDEASVIRRVFRAAGRRMGADGVGGGIWGHIWRRTRGRPRDMIHFFRAAARAALGRKLDEVDGRALRQAQLEHAAYLRADMAAEMKADWPDADHILAVLGELRGREVELATLHVLIEDRIAIMGEREATAASRRFIDRLFEISAIGNVRGATSGRDAEVFAHASPSASFDYGERAVVHAGLWPSLAPEMA